MAATAAGVALERAERFMSAEVALSPLKTAPSTPMPPSAATVVAMGSVEEGEDFREMAVAGNQIAGEGVAARVATVATVGNPPRLWRVPGAVAAAERFSQVDLVLQAPVA